MNLLVPLKMSKALFSVEIVPPTPASGAELLMKLLVPLRVSLALFVT